VLPKILDVVRMLRLVCIDQYALNFTNAFFSDISTVDGNQAVTDVELMPGVVLRKLFVTELVVWL
jgi:hypothetical protein